MTARGQIDAAIAEHPYSASGALKQMRILAVDDQEMNVKLLRRLLGAEGYGQVESTTDPGRTRELCQSFRPDLLLLDLHMPGQDGFDVLTSLADIISSGRLQVLVLSGDVTVSARRRALALGARDFLMKPLDHVEVLLRVRNLLEMRHLQQQLERQNEILAERVAERTHDLDDARREVLERLARVAEYRDYATGEHTQRVGRTAAMIAQVMGLSRDLIEMYRDAAPLHDIGKLGVTDAVLLKRGKLDADEWEVMRAHVRIGAAILSGSRSPVLRLAEEIAASHHERWDGTGYGAQLTGELIPLAGRITAVADVFDALTHERPYKLPLSVAEAVSEINRQSGKQFDPKVVEAFAELDHDSLL
jgi:putative two-component system response regulator